MKYKIISQSGPVNLDERASYNGGWKMKGHDVKKFWYPGKDGLPDCTLYIHSKTIIVWIDKKQYIVASSDEEAERMANLAIIQAVEKFKGQQKRFGVRIETDHGIGNKHHYGFLISEEHPAAQRQPNVKNWWMDKSIGSDFAGYKEVETTVRASATALEQTLLIAPKFPDIIKQATDPLQQGLSRVEALVQGGTTAEQKVIQLMGIIGELLERSNRQDARINELERNQK